MNPRSLPMINAIGCLVLAAVVFTQWTKESREQRVTAQLRAELAAANLLAETETHRATSLEDDITILKHSLESTQRAAIEATTALEEKESRVANSSEELAAAKDQIAKWEAAIAERDAKIRSLDADLISTRSRLDEAIVKLKQAGAR